MTDWEEISATYIISRLYKELPQFKKKKKHGRKMNKG